MMERATLELVAKLTAYGADKEMIKLGQTIFESSNPTAEDINALNDIKGFAPILYTYENDQVMWVIKSAEENLFDIFV